MFFLYTLLYTVALALVFPLQYLKRPRELRSRWGRERFGLIDSPATEESGDAHHVQHQKEKQRETVWLHSVSVGEVNAALPLLKALKEKYPSKRLILSTVTDTGQNVARERSPEGTRIVYLPFDIPFMIRNILKRFKPDMLIVIETELWPNLFRIFKEHKIPILLLNGRISKSSHKGYQKISFFMRKVLDTVDFFGMQGQDDAHRIVEIGANVSKVSVIGNFKFDTHPTPGIPKWTAWIKGPTLTAGSTHEGEEELLLSVYGDLKKDFRNLNLIIAPRHPERFKSTEEMLTAKNIPYLKRSTFTTSSPESKSLEGQVILLDTIGELSSVYGASDIAIIGKSFRGYGGQNPLEPACWGKPVVCGPHMENFPVIQDFIREGAAVQVTEEGLYGQLKELLTSPERAQQIGEKAKELYRKNAGAVVKAMEIIENHMKK